jgi:hypothetical protein
MTHETATPEAYVAPAIEARQEIAAPLVGALSAVS